MHRKAGVVRAFRLPAPRDVLAARARDFVRDTFTAAEREEALLTGDLDWIAERWTTEGDAPGVAGDFGIVALGGGLGSLAMLTVPLAVPRTTRAGERNDWRIRL